MQIEYIREPGSRGIRFFVPSNIDYQDGNDRAFRAFAEEHEDSTLVLIKCGHWPDRHGRSCDLYTLRRKTPLQRNNAETPADPPAPTPKPWPTLANVLFIGVLIGAAITLSNPFIFPRLQMITVRIVLIILIAAFVYLNFQIRRGFRR